MAPEIAGSVCVRDGRLTVLFNHGGPTSLAAVDLDAGSVEVLPSASPQSVSAVVWNCDGSDFVVLADLHILMSPSGDVAELIVPGNTFLGGVGAC